MINLTIQDRIVATILFAGILVYLFYLLRSNRLSGPFAVVWIFADIAVYAIIIIAPIQTLIMRIIGTKNPYFSIFLLLFIWLLLLILDLLVRVSQLNKRISVINQELALLTEKLQDKKRK
jgi:hypothetical protein